MRETREKFLVDLVCLVDLAHKVKGERSKVKGNTYLVHLVHLVIWLIERIGFIL